MLTVEHFIVSFSLGLFLAFLGSSSTLTTGTPMSWGGPMEDGYITLLRILQLLFYYTACAGVSLLLHLRLDGIL